LYKEIKLAIKNSVQQELIESDSIDDEEVYRLIDQCISNKSHEKYISLADKLSLRSDIFYAIRGLDVLSELLNDDEITEIMVNGYEKIFIEKKGRLFLSEKSFDSKELLQDMIQKIVALSNRTVNMSSPIVDARLEDGSRVNVVLEPVSLDGPILTIRRFPQNPLTMERLINLGAINEEVADFLKILVKAKYNILISGGTGSGKTTFLNALSGFIPCHERIITIEDSAELKIQNIDNLVRLETRNTNVEGCKEISIRDLIKTALRMRPDRIIVGEVRGEEAIDMLQAFNVGQDGSLSTIHANSAEDALSRLETLVMLNSDNIPLNALRRQIASGVDLIIQLSRYSDFSRRISQIMEVNGMNGDFIRTKILYEFKENELRKCNDMENRLKVEKAGFCDLFNIQVKH